MLLSAWILLSAVMKGSELLLSSFTVGFDDRYLVVYGCVLQCHVVLVCSLYQTFSGWLLGRANQWQISDLDCMKCHEVNIQYVVVSDSTILSL